MLLTAVLAIVGTIVTLVFLALLGHRILSRASLTHVRQIERVKEFHAALVAYAESRGADQQAFQQLSMQSSAIETVLGWDNIVSGVQVGFYMLNRAPLLPLALQEMRREYGEGSSWRDRGGMIADVVQTTLFRHVGRRAEQAEKLHESAGRLSACVAAGWAAVSALPMSILSAFGLLNMRSAEAARKSVLFRLWSLVLALAAISAPILAYLADSDKIDAAAHALLHLR